MIKALILSLSLLISAPVLAASFPWEAFGNSAHMIGIGRIEGFDRSAQVLFENPAGLSRAHGMAFASMYSTLVDNQVYYGNVAMSLPLFNGRVGLGIMQYQIPNNDITAANSFNEYIVVGSFDYQRGVIKAGYQYPLLPEISIGANLGYHFATIGSVHAEGWSMDVGTTATFDKVTLSLAGKNILASPLSYSNGESEFLPSYVVAASEWALDPFILYGQIGQQNNTQTQHVGIKYFPLPSDMLYISAGMGDLVTVTGKTNKVALGVGLDLKAIQFFLAYEKSDYLLRDKEFYFSVATQFD